jgi:hypothetical protein
MTSELELNADFRDMLVELSRAGAEYLIVGGFAVSAYGYQRATKDIDVFIRPTADNAARVLRAVTAFGAPTFDATAEDLATPGLILQLGVPPRRIDIINRIEGVTFDEACVGSLVVAIGDLDIPVIGFEALLKNKRATGRAEDMKDVRMLESARAKRHQ